MESTHIAEIVDEGISTLGYTDTFLVDIKAKGNKVEIFVDSDGGIGFEKCQKLSRWVEAIFDEKAYFGGQYILEVSSPGVGSPLKLLRQYPKNVGRDIEIKTAEKSVKGKLEKVEGDQIHVTYETKVKEGKKNKKIIVTDIISHESIIESKIKINFNQ
jgi:ribosome maturation factor RimP